MNADTKNLNKKYTKIECYAVWKTPKKEITQLTKLLGRTLGGIEWVYRVKEDLITDNKTKIYRPNESNPERYFEEFVEMGFEYVN